MNGAVDEVHLTFAAPESNAGPYLGEGWHAAEAGHRWTDGGRSVVRLPPLRARPWFVLTLRCSPYNPKGVAQTLTIEINGVEASSYRPTSGLPYAIAVSGERLREDGDNILVLHHPHAISPVEAQPGHRDARVVALAFQSLAMEPLDAPPHAEPRPLPPAPAPAEAAQAKAVVEAFQSLGADCFVGLVQRHFGAEPFGLLRFAGMPPERLIAGLQSRFRGIGDASKLTLFAEAGALHGRQADYWMVYHLFRPPDGVELISLAGAEAKRLEYLARLFFEQLENDEKIFLRTENFETPGAALALHRALCAYNPQARLLILDATPEAARENVGRVFELRPRLYRGYLSKARRPGEEALPDHSEWLRSMATVVAYERRLAPHGPSCDETGDDLGQHSHLDHRGYEPMSGAVDKINLTFAARDSNVEPYLGEGWHGAEAAHRWTDGLRSVLRLPPLRARTWFVMTLQGWALNIGGVTPPQILNIGLNGVFLRRLQLDMGMPMAFAVPGDLVRSDAENIVVLDHPAAARPSELQAGHGDGRLLSLAFQRFEVEPLDGPLALAPRLLPQAAPPAGPDERKAVAEAFQSLGQTCAFGNFQRHYHADPFGLLRFAGTFPDKLVHGLRTRFAGVGDPDKLSFFTPEGSRELHGKHAVYGLDYHTFKMVDETDIAALTVKEAQRLDYLARLFFEQLENDEKIFLRAAGFRTPEEALALHMLLRAYHPRARLLLLQDAPAHAPERLGRVVEMRPGLYCGYVSNALDLGGTHGETVFEEWLRVCSTVVAYEAARG